MATLDTKLTRVENNIKNSLEKVAAKGVTVPAGANSDNLPSLIEAIQQGPTLPTLTNPGAAADLLTGKELINAAGEKVTGSMPNRGAISATLNLDTTSYTPAKGYHSGSGKVQVDSSINTTVDTQADLIAQIKSEHETQIAAIKTALEGKAAGGGGAAVETCTVTFPIGIEAQCGWYSDGENIVNLDIIEAYAPNASIRVAKNSILYCELNGGILGELSGDVELLYDSSMQIIAAVRGDCSIS